MYRTPKISLGPNHIKNRLISNELRGSLNKQPFIATVDKATRTFKDSYNFRNRVSDFLDSRDREKDLPHAIFFINNLIKLKTIKNPDGTFIKGVERIFENAEEMLSQGKNVAGFYFEAELALSLIEAGFSIKEVSVSKITNDKGETEELRDHDGYPREIDMIAEKEIDGESFRFDIEAKTGFKIKARNNNRLNYQVAALTEFAHTDDSIPVMILRDREPILSENGELVYLKPKEPKNKIKKQCKNYLIHYPQLLIWKVPLKNFSDVEELNLVDSKELIRQRTIAA